MMIRTYLKIYEARIYEAFVKYKIIHMEILKIDMACIFSFNFIHPST